MRRRDPMSTNGHLPEIVCRRVWTWRLLVSIVIAGLCATAGPLAAADDGNRIVLGRISEKPSNHFERMRALADYMAVQLAPDGITGVDVVMVDSLEEMREMLASGGVDFMSETAFMASELVDAGVAELMLREWKQGVAEYHSLFFVRADSGLKDIADLPGHSIAFEDPGSTSAYLVPRVTLELAGVELLPLAAPGIDVPEGVVGYIFAEGEANVVAWVHRGLADAGVVSNLDWENDSEAPEFLKGDLNVIHETPPIIRSLMLVRRGLAPEMKARLSEILQGMHETEDGRRTLQRYFGVSRYDRIDEAAMDGLETVRQIRRFMEQ